MQTSQSYNDQTAHISLQISINVKKQQEQNRGRCAIQATPHPVKSSQKSLKVRSTTSTAFPVPEAFPPSVKRYLRTWMATRKGKNELHRHIFVIILMLRYFLCCQIQHFPLGKLACPAVDGISPALARPSLRKSKRRATGARLEIFLVQQISAWRTGSCDGPLPCRTSCARPRGCHGSGSPLPSAQRAGRAGATAMPG